MNRGIFHYSRNRVFSHSLERVGILITLSKCLLLSSRQKKPYSPLVAPDSSDGEEETIMHYASGQKAS